jgi:hypothetical protein
MALTPLAAGPIEQALASNMNLPCVLKGYLNEPHVLLTGGILMVSLVVAVVLAPLLLYLYRRRIIQLMGGVAPTKVSALGLVQPTLPDELESAGVTLVPGDGSSDSTESLENAGRRRARQLAHAVMKTVLLFAIITIATRLAMNLPAANPRLSAVLNAVVWSATFFVWVLLMLGMAWPIVLLGTADPRFARWLLFVTVPCFLLYLATGFGPLSWHELSQQVPDVVFILFMCIGLGSRHMRNVVPTLMLAVFTILLIRLELAFVWYGIDACSGHSPVLSGAVKVLVWLTIIPSIWCAYRMLGALASAYWSKRFSDAQLQMLLWFVLMALPLVTNVIFRSAGPNAPLILAGIPVAATAGAYYWLLHHLPAPHRPPVTLLLLRVFGQSRREERLLDRLAFHWRFVGPVCMIGGPDLAKAYVEPHEIAAFLSRRLSGGFIADAASLARRMREIDLEPDPDTRYRVNEFFCAGEIWIAAARHLMQRCDVVVIDLRQFHAGRLGTATELEMLSQLGALGKTIIIVGEATDMDAMREAIGAAHESPPLHVLKEADRFKPYEFFAKVVQVAERRVQC